MIVGKAIYYLLTNATDVTDVVSTRIYPEVAQQDSDLPFIVYNVTNNEPTDTKPEPSKLDTAQVEVNIYAESYTEAIDLAVAVRAALDRVKGTYNGVNVQSIQYQNEVIDFDEPQRAYNIGADYDVRISRSGFEIAQGSPITGVQLGELSDVDVTGVTNGQLIAYNDVTGNWEAADDAGGAETLNDLTDVDAGQPSAGQLLSYGQGEWTTIDQEELTIPIGSVTGLQSELNTIPDGLDDLDDVKIIGTPSEGDALVYTSGFWSRGTAGASTLGDLDDVNTTGAAAGSLISYNGVDGWEISAAELPDDAVYYHNRYASEAETLLDGATETVELYYTAQADGDGLHEDAQTDTAQSGYDIRRKLYYAEKAQADPDTSADWTQFTAIADNTTFANAKAALLAYLKERTGGTVPISLKMTWEEVAQAPAFTGLLNESYGSGAEAAYSTRRLNGNVTECMVIRRASDSTTETIGFDGSGNIDESAIETFCTGTTCTVVTWKDQSGNGNDATAAASGNEPTIYTGGALVKQDGRVGIDFDGSTDYLISTISSVSQPFDFYSVFKYDTIVGGGTERLYYTTTVNRGRNSSSFDYINAGVVLSAGNKSRELIRLQETHVYNGSSGSFRRSGTQMVSGNVGGSSTGTSLYIGSRDTGAANNCIEGVLQEIILFDNSKSAGDRTSVEENQGDYFTQNTPLLDTYSGAAAAYSLRLLDSSYVGSAVEVYNGSSYADIGFNVFGELDTVALAAHCGSNDGFVSKWYDQSGNSNDAAQATTAKMPKIYDGTTGVVTQNDNSKPALLSDTGDFLQATGAITVSNRTNYQWSVYSLTAYNYFPPVTGLQLSDGHFDTSGRPLTATIRSATVSGNATNAISLNTTYLKHSYADTVNVRSYLDGNASPIIDISDTNSNWGSSNLEIFASSATIQAGIKLSEFILWQSDQSSNRTGIEDNINTFYNIY